jgi:hypothetical protein
MRPTTGIRPPEAPTAAAICKQFELGEDARGLLDDEASADEFVEALVQNRLLTDAIRFTAYRLSKREAVWWGCLCAWEVCRPKPTPAAAEALKASALWARDPSEENRRAAEAAAEPAVATPAGNLAMAAFLSGGSMSPPKMPVVAPAPGLTARLVSEAVLLASRLAPPDQTPAHQRRFLGIASEITSGRLSLATQGKSS